MADQQHRATAGEWASIRARADDTMTCSVILELRDRIEALEAAKSNHPEIPDSSLKERIKSRMIQSSGSTWDEFTASIIVEVAAWLRKSYGTPTATTYLLEQEAER
mgnify:CR=1 FL=1